MLESLSSQQLIRAARVKEKIEALELELESLLGRTGAAGQSSTGGGGISAAGKARIAAAQRARWAKSKSNPPVNGSTPSGATRRRRMSKAGRAKLAKAARERWAKAKAAGKSAL
ncbi:MAG TPA: hypothetical protein VMZ27_07460 [Candidatus Saccharimonadales bacterium]|nr:hypothetical protein [Candidatus Saccharimonadales bacterium]